MAVIPHQAKYRSAFDICQKCQDNFQQKLRLFAEVYSFSLTTPVYRIVLLSVGCFTNSKKCNGLLIGYSTQGVESQERACIHYLLKLVPLHPLFFALVMFLVLPIEIGHTYDSILLSRVPCHIILTRRPA